MLVETSHPGNMGATARAMKTMGLRELVLVRPRAEFPGDEATARAAGADEILANARITESVEEAIADCGFVAGASARLAEHRGADRESARMRGADLAEASGGPRSAAVR